MRIELFDNWVLTSDNRQFIVGRAVAKKSKDSDNKEQIVNATYHTSLSAALGRAFQQRLLNCKAKTFEELLIIARETRDHLKKIREDVDKCLT